MVLHDNYSSLAGLLTVTTVPDLCNKQKTAKRAIRFVNKRDYWWKSYFNLISGTNRQCDNEDREREKSDAFKDANELANYHGRIALILFVAFQVVCLPRRIEKINYCYQHVFLNTTVEIFAKRCWQSQLSYQTTLKRVDIFAAQTSDCKKKMFSPKTAPPEVVSVTLFHSSQLFLPTTETPLILR